MRQSRRAVEVVVPESDEAPLLRMRDAVSAAAGHDAPAWRRMSANSLIAALSVTALTPVIQAGFTDATVLGQSLELAGSVGSNVLAGVIMAAADRLRSRRLGAPVDEGQLREAVAGRIAAAFQESAARPPTRPRARAAARPSRVPETMSSRMNSASAAKTWKTSRPPGVVMSRFS
jgi:hypothetical protein